MLLPWCSVLWWWKSTKFILINSLYCEDNFILVWSLWIHGLSKENGCVQWSNIISYNPFQIWIVIHQQNIQWQFTYRPPQHPDHLIIKKYFWDVFSILLLFFSLITKTSHHSANFSPNSVLRMDACFYSKKFHSPYLRHNFIHSIYKFTHSGFKEGVGLFWKAFV